MLRFVDAELLARLFYCHGTAGLASAVLNT